MPPELEERPARMGSTFRTVLKSRNRNRFGWAVRTSPVRVNRLSAVTRLWVGTLSGGHAVFAANFALCAANRASPSLRG